MFCNELYFNCIIIPYPKLGLLGIMKYFLTQVELLILEKLFFKNTLRQIIIFVEENVLFYAKV